MPVIHPCLDENGERLPIVSPDDSSPAHCWTDPSEAATFSLTAPGVLPPELNGVVFAPVAPGDPSKIGFWKRLGKNYRHFPEPPLPKTKKPWTSGTVMIEPDGRIWLVHPSNGFGGVKATFPRGHLEAPLSLLANALKETWEESGLLAEPVAYLCDVERVRTVTRFYLAVRRGGTPISAGWESQAVSLVPRSQLFDFVNRPNDRRVLEPLAAAWAERNRPAFEPRKKRLKRAH